MITITEKAIEKLKEFSEAEDIGHNVVRIKCIGGGCAGMQNDMFFDNFIDETDEIIEQDGIMIIVDQLSAMYLDGTTIDYICGAISSGFKFINPNTTGNCGCGSSVQF